MPGKAQHFQGPQVSCCAKYLLFASNVLFWVGEQVKATRPAWVPGRGEGVCACRLAALFSGGGAEAGGGGGGAWTGRIHSLHLVGHKELLGPARDRGKQPERFHSLPFPLRVRPLR